MSSVDFKGIYASRPHEYHRLIEAEDKDSNLIRCLERIIPLKGIDVVEFGAGTGRLSCLLAPIVKSLRAFDIEPSMLALAEANLAHTQMANWTIGVASNESLPVGTSSADLAIEGWSFGHQIQWYPSAWRESVGQALDEMMRVLRVGGIAVVIETLGVQVAAPTPPSFLVEFYDWLESERGFTRTWARTDFQFASAHEAAQRFRFFFGDHHSNVIEKLGTAVVPSCTGLWWQRKV